MSVEALLRVERHALRAGDVLVLTSRCKLSAVAVERLRANVRDGLGAALADNVRVLVFDDGIELEVLCDPRRDWFSRFWGALREPFAWQDVRDTGRWLYQENAVTGSRRVHSSGSGGHQPISRGWLQGGSFDPGVPPNQGSGGQKAA